MSEEKVSETVMRRMARDWFMWFVWLVWFAERNKRDEPDRPNKPDRLFPMLTKTDSKAFGL